MKTIEVPVYWEERNYCCGWSYPGFGAVMCTGKDIAGLKQDFNKALVNQVNSMAADGEKLPKWLTNGCYTIKYTLAVSALLRLAENYITMAALSRATGINAKQLSHYANNSKKPRVEQRERIINGLHYIGEKIAAFA